MLEDGAIEGFVGGVCAGADRARCTRSRRSRPARPLLLRIPFVPDAPVWRSSSEGGRRHGAQHVPVRRGDRDLPEPGPPHPARGGRRGRRRSRRRPRVAGRRCSASISWQVEGRRRRSGAPETSPSSSPRTAATSSTPCGVGSRRACPTSAWWPAPRAAQAVIDELRADGVPEDPARPDRRPGRASTSGARTPARGRPVDPRGDRRGASRGTRAAAPAPARSEPSAPRSGAPPMAVDPICGMTIAAVAGTPSLEQPRRDGLLLLRGLRDRSSGRGTSMRRPRVAPHEPARGHGRGGRRDPRARARHRDARAAPRRRRLPRRRGPGDVDVPEPAPAAAPAARGRGGRRQDRGRQVAGGRAGHAADPAAVLRGDRRGGGAVRVELPAPAAQHPPRRLAAARRSSEEELSARTTSSAARCCARSSIPARGRRCC